jgi:hypothetical protein
MISAMIAVVGLAIGVSACGASIDKKEEDIVRCGGFVGAFLVLQMGNKPQPFANSVNNASGLGKDGGAVLALRVFTWGPVTKKYEANHTTGQERRVGQQGEAIFKNYLDNGDVDGAAKYLNACFSTYDDIAKYYDW